MSRPSHELLYQLTRKHNSYLRHNLHVTFTADPFSATNIPTAGAWGLLTPKATSVLPATGPGAKPTDVVVMRKTNRRRVTKKGQTNNQKAPGTALTVKTVDSKRATGSRCPLVQARGVKLHQAALRAAKNRAPA